MVPRLHRVSVLRILPLTASRFPNTTISPLHSTAIVITIASQTHTPPTPLLSPTSPHTSPHPNHTRTIAISSCTALLLKLIIPSFPHIAHAMALLLCGLISQTVPVAQFSPTTHERGSFAIISSFHCFQLLLLMSVRCSRGFTHELLVMAFRTGFRVWSLFRPCRK
jgi:hypothetical protein